MEPPYRFRGSVGFLRAQQGVITAGSGRALWEWAPWSTAAFWSLICVGAPGVERFIESASIALTAVQLAITLWRQASVAPPQHRREGASLCLTRSSEIRPTRLWDGTYSDRRRTVADRRRGNCGNRTGEIVRRHLRPLRRLTLVLLGLVAALAISGAAPASGALPGSVELNKYLIVGMQNAGDGDSIDVNSSKELGANQSFLSTSDPNTRSVFASRWASAGSPNGNTTPPPPAAPVMTGIEVKSPVVV